MRALSGRILAHALAGQTEPEAVAAAVEGTVRRLHEEVSSLIGPVGLLALVRRATHLSRREFPWLDQLEVQVGHVMALQGLTECVRTQGREQVAEGATLLLSHLLELLCNFIGQDLTLRMVRRGWPTLLETSRDE
jgi:hypothetical protein